MPWHKCKSNIHLFIWDKNCPKRNCLKIVTDAWGWAGSVKKPNLILGIHCFQRECKKQEKQLSLTMDLPLIGQVSEGLIQSPSSLEVAFKWTSQGVFILMADKPFLAWRGLFLLVHLSVHDLVFTITNNHTPNTIKMSVWLLVFLKTVYPQRANAAISQSCIVKSWICDNLESSHAVGPCEVLVFDVEYAQFLFLSQWLGLFFLCVS